MHFTLTDLVTDIAQNAAESGASLVELEVKISNNRKSGAREFSFLVKDNGKGMNDDELKFAEDPFVTDGVKHPNRKIGLGIPFFIQTVEACHGGWDIKSNRGKGTEVSGWFNTNNFDTPPVGDISGMFRTVLMFEGPDDIKIHRVMDADGEQYEYRIGKKELKDAIGDLADANSLVLVDEYLRSLELFDNFSY